MPKRGQPALGDVLANAIRQLRVALVAPGHACGQVRREARRAALGTDEAAEQRDALLLQRPVVQVVPAAGARSPARCRTGAPPGSVTR